MVNIRIVAYQGLAFIGIGFVRQSDHYVLDSVFPLLVLEISRIEHLDRELIAETLRENKETICVERHVGWVFRYLYRDHTLPEKLDYAIPRVLINATSHIIRFS